MADFVPNRSLLNPKFEGYRFDPISQDDTVLRYNLQYHITQTAPAGNTPLSFQEVQSRITHNHICVSGDKEHALYIDADCRIIVINLGIDLVPSFRVVYELPKSIQTPSVDTFHREYPSAASLDPNNAFVSDGHGSLYAFETSKTGHWSLLHEYNLTTEDDKLIPFKIHSVEKISSTLVIAILSSRHYGQNSESSPSATRSRHRPVEFDIWAAKFVQPFIETSNSMEILWHRRGNDVPVYTLFDRSREAYFLLGSSVYQGTNVPPVPSYEPSPEELVPVPRQGENLDGENNAAEKPPPYSWTQSSDSVTVAFPLPATTSKSDIKVLFSQRNISIHIEGYNDNISISLPYYSDKALWNDISSSSSYWTWDREAEHTFGLLTLYLDKQHEGTKWMSVFAEAGTTEPEVPETLDPSELWHIRESLEKYTSALRDGEDASGLGLGRGVPGLAEGELDDEVDSSIGRTAQITWVGKDGTVPSWALQQSVPFQLLSTAVPGSNIPITSLIVKHGLDGAVFSLRPGESTDSAPMWSHTSTFSALAFVLASKQDTRFTYHVDNAVFAFENGSRDRGGNVYIYRASSPSEKWAKQTVLKVGDALAGSLLGVGELKPVNGRSALICLSETELIVIRNVV